MAKTKYSTAPDHELTGYPPGIPYIIGNEGCERFSFYGMKAILYVYIVGLYMGIRGMPEAQAEQEATAIYHLWSAGVYATPLIGAVIADRLLGKYNTILYLSLVYCLGHLALAVFEDPSWQVSLLGEVWVDPLMGLYIGLALIAVGSGGIKPCVSANVGDQFGKKNWHLLEKVYNAFYFIINFGSAFATILIPIIRGKQTLVDGQYMYDGSVSWAFGVPGILMGIASFWFWAGRRHFVHVEPTPGGRLGLLDVAASVALIMTAAWPIFFGEMTDGWVLDLVISLICFAVFAVLFSWRQRLAADDGFLAQTWYALRARLGFEKQVPEKTALSLEKEGAQIDLQDHWFYGPSARRFGNLAAEGPVAVWRIISIFLMVSVFWALFDQHGSTWVKQASTMNLRLEFTFTGWLTLGVIIGLLIGLAVALSLKGLGRKVGFVLGIGAGVGLGLTGYALGPGFDLQESQIQALNPFMVMLLIPYTTFGLYPLLSKLGLDMHPLRRMTLGMLMAASAYVSVALIQRGIDAGEANTVHVAWQMIPYLLMTLSEVMVSITGLEFAYSQAPKSMKSVIMSFWLFNVTLGNLLVAFLAPLQGSLGLEQFFWVFAGLMLVAGVIFALRARVYTYRDFQQE